MLALYRVDVLIAMTALRKGKTEKALELLEQYPLVDAKPADLDAVNSFAHKRRRQSRRESSIGKTMPIKSGSRAQSGKLGGTDSSTR